ncbi:MAG: AMP-binding protein, partial [Candidatus Krumholzibacteriia bacterium]
MLVHEFLERSAARLPEKEALIAGAQRITYGELDASANRLARVLRGLGVGYGDRVAVLLDNSSETVISIFGILKADAVFLVVNPTTKTNKIEYILNNCRATALVTHAAKWRSVEQAASAVPSLKAVVLVGKSPRGGDAGAATRLGGDGNAAARFGGAVVAWDEALSAESAEAPPRKAIDIDLAALIYTSGTTGNPKGVMMAHRNIVSASTSITTYLENRESDVVLDVLPLSFDYGLYQVIMAAQYG